MPTPIIESIPYRTDSQELFDCLHRLPGAVWLDSGRSRVYNSRYDILTALPREQITSSKTGCHVHYRDGSTGHISSTAMAYVEKCLTTLGLNQPSGEQRLNENSNDLPFTGGAIGYLSYESLHGEFGLTSNQDLPPQLPDIYFGIYDWALIQDHLKHESYLYFLDICPADVMEQVRQQLMMEPEFSGEFRCDAMVPDITPDTYMNAVSRIQKHIQAGDCYQVNFTQRFTGEFAGSTATAYRQLREVLPSPFSAYIDTPGGTLMSLSPERFIELNGRHIKTQPIKGTAPRDSAPERDSELAQELQSSEKNRAENLMIVDLLRNDLSKVCEPFSVQVPELFGLQSYTNVHHLVSTITGTLREGISTFDLLSACFPGGSITGAPKKRAMEIIDTLETQRRSVYCGSIIYLSLNGRMDSNIAIRTLVQTGNQIYCWGGGGVVADSDPAMEYQESLHKIKLLLDTLQSKQQTQAKHIPTKQ